MLVAPLQGVWPRGASFTLILSCGNIMSTVFVPKPHKIQEMFAHGWHVHDCWLALQEHTVAAVPVAPVSSCGVYLLSVLPHARAERVAHEEIRG